MPITVLLTDDKESVRRAIRLLLDSDPEIRMVGEAVYLSADDSECIQPRAADCRYGPTHARCLICESSGNQITVEQIRVAIDCNLFLER